MNISESHQKPNASLLQDLGKNARNACERADLSIPPRATLFSFIINILLTLNVDEFLF